MPGADRTPARVGVTRFIGWLNADETRKRVGVTWSFQGTAAMPAGTRPRTGTRRAVSLASADLIKRLLQLQSSVAFEHLSRFLNTKPTSTAPMLKNFANNKNDVISSRRRGPCLYPRTRFPMSHRRVRFFFYRASRPTRCP